MNTEQMKTTVVVCEYDAMWWDGKLLAEVTSGDERIIFVFHKDLRPEKIQGFRPTEMILLGSLKREDTKQEIDYIKDVISRREKARETLERRNITISREEYRELLNAAGRQVEI